MSEFFPIIFGLAFIGTLGGAAILFLKVFNPPWWRHRWVKLGVVGAMIIGAIAITCWALGTAYGLRLLLAFGATITALTLILLIALILSLPISGIIHGVSWLIGNFTSRKYANISEPIDHSKRLFLKTTAAAIPSITIISGVGGFAQSFASTNIPTINMIFPDLPPDLNGFRMLQISDCHLGLYMGLPQLDELLESVDNRNLDLILITGDLADDLNVLPQTLIKIAKVKAKYGVYSSLGNHEYYRGIARVREIYKAGPIPLIVNDGLTLSVGNSKLFIGGADDPRFLRKDSTEFFKSTVARAIKDKPDDSFSILMSHRPEAFDIAADSGVNLTLSGHTHGGQIGFAGRSVFEPILSYKYLWGKYLHTRGGQLYTTCGAGHWFPFRLGCPSEAPLIILNQKKPK